MLFRLLKEKNLSYKVIHVEDEAQRYIKLRELLEFNNVPTIIYTSRRKIVESLPSKIKK